MKLTGYIVCPKIYLLLYVTWDDDVTSRDNDIIMSKQPPSWIRHLGFRIFSKRQKTAQNYWKILKTNKNVLKTRKQMKIIALKLFFINRNRKITNLGKHACQNAVAMVTSSS
ncbi:hypothetical protein ACROYT_G030220 [Oculina patagonica]